MSRDLRRRRRRPRCKQTSKNLSRVDRRRHSTSNPNAVKYGSFSLSPFSPNILPLYLFVSPNSVYSFYLSKTKCFTHILVLLVWTCYNHLNEPFEYHQIRRNKQSSNCVKPTDLVFFLHRSYLHSPSHYFLPLCLFVCLLEYSNTSSTRDFSTKILVTFSRKFLLKQYAIIIIDRQTLLALRVVLSN